MRKKETHLFGRSKNEKKIFDNYKKGKKIRWILQKKKNSFHSFHPTKF